LHSFVDGAGRSPTQNQVFQTDASEIQFRKIRFNGA